MRYLKEIADTESSEKLYLVILILQLSQHSKELFTGLRKKVTVSGKRIFPGHILVVPTLARFFRKQPHIYSLRSHQNESSRAASTLFLL